MQNKQAINQSTPEQPEVDAPEFDFSELDKIEQDFENENQEVVVEKQDTAKPEDIPENNNPATVPLDDTVTDADEPEEVNQVVPGKSPYYSKIDGILEEGLRDMYDDLPEALKPEFRRRGEEATNKIDQMMQSAKVKLQEVVKLILNWLRIVPGVNKFFIEKEATIKAKKIINLKNKAE